jgi:uncharacterized protein (DUF433 family)
MVAARNDYLGNGIYRFSEAAKLTSVPTRTVSAWFNGRLSKGSPSGRGRVFQSDYASSGVISFLDLIEVLVAGKLRQHGVRLPTIRRAYDVVASRLRTTHPFSRVELVTDGQNIFVQTAAALGEVELIEVVRRQHFFHDVMMPYLKRVTYDSRDHFATSWDIDDGVTVDPARRLGKPIVASSAMPTAVLAAAFDANGADAEAVADWYGISVDQVETAVKFERRLAGK